MFCSHFVAFVYPAYMSYKTLEYSGRNAGDDLTPLMHWLTYWVVYAMFVAVELVVDPLFASMPWYVISKLVFLFWCFLPQTQGCVWVYRLVVRPALHANETRIDKLIDRCHFAAMQAGAEIRDVSSEVFTTAVSNFGASLFVSSLNAAAAKQKSGSHHERKPSGRAAAAEQERPKAAPPGSPYDVDASGSGSFDSSLDSSMDGESPANSPQAARQKRE